MTNTDRSGLLRQVIPGHGIAVFEVNVHNPGLLLYASRKNKKNTFQYLFLSPLGNLGNSKEIPINRPTLDQDLQKGVALSLGWGAYAKGTFIPLKSLLAKYDFYWYQQIKRTTTYKNVANKNLKKMLDAETHGWRDDISRGVLGWKNPYGAQYINAKGHVIMEDFPGVHHHIPAKIAGNSLKINMTCNDKMKLLFQGRIETVTRVWEFKTRLVKVDKKMKNVVVDIGKEFRWGLTVISSPKGNLAFIDNDQKLRIAN